MRVQRSDHYGNKTETDVPVLKIATAAILALVVLVGGCGLVTSTYKTDGTEVAVVRNAGPFDDRTIAEVTGPASSFQIPGFFQEVRKYIHESEQRFYSIVSDADRADSPTATYVEVPTKDGVEVRLEANTYFHTNFTGEDDDQLLRDFDQQFGNRDFDGERVWSDEGWENFLEAQFRPVLVSTFREEIGGLECAELISSCGLIQQGARASGQPDFEAVTEAGESNQQNFAQVAEAIQAKLQTRIETALGGDYFGDYQVQIERVVLPENIQTAINNAQAAFAQIAQQRANAEAAKFEAERLRRIAEAYEDAPALAMIEAAKALGEDNPNATVILGGDNFAIPTR